ncbi:hypothetical protein ACROAH_14830 [Shewanella oncorhynchi]|uniref:hypothetical protein n=1 Tax=Shewanella TaxID=22 RepID=UPI001565B14A|nr:MULTISPECIES: hypothetical protein [unclassified Shewanella]MCU8031800.1 hypothetical protein [Shewanella sp. SM73]MCU8078440.1 hypothetical protein [Shewanella sp. SM103]NRD33823.1 hypothetical protein [Shewanella sp. DC2-4]
MAITKEQWQQLETEMAGSFVNVKFSYQGHEISVQRERKSESSTELAVYIDGYIKGGWICSPENQPEDTPKILPQVWNTKTRSAYSPKKIADLEKKFGKRKAKEYFPNLHHKVGVLMPFFSKASVLCRQFKKLEGLALTHAFLLDEPE